MDKYIIDKALLYVKENKPKDFFNLFFYVKEYNNMFELEGWTESGVNMIIMIKKEDWKFDFQSYVINFNIDTEIMLHRENEHYCEVFTISHSVKDFTDFHKWLVMISKIIDGEVIGGVTENAIMERYEPFEIYVLTFDKRYYNKKEIENKTDIEKYNLAKNDKKYCEIFKAKEYTYKLNNFIPMHGCVWTYIVKMYSNE